MEDVKAKCDDVVRSITDLPIEAWAGWIAYILESLDNEATIAGRRSAFENVLLDLDMALDLRFEDGAW